MQSMDATLICQHCGAVNALVEARCFSCQEDLAAEQAEFVQASVTPVMKPVVVEQAPQERTLPAGFLLKQRYHIIAPVGRGGFGIIYKARDLRRHRDVAVKQICLDALSPRDVIQATDSYNREIGLHTPLKHKYIPRVYAHFTDPHNWYVVMKFIRGETLEDYLQRQPGHRLPVRKVASIGTRLCLVLDYLHKQEKIIFRDVKPANIMLTRRGHLYLIDFGIARKYVPDKKRDTIPLGTPGYAAPEQYGLAQSTEQTDMYGLGATLRRLATGVDPSEEASGDQAPQLPPRLQRLLDHMLAQEASTRPKNIGKIHQQLLIVRVGMLRYLLSLPLKVLAGFLFAASLELILAGSFLLLTRFISMTVELSPVILILGALLLVAELIVSLGIMTAPRKRMFGLGMFVFSMLFLIYVVQGLMTTSW